MDDCLFCRIARGEAEADILHSDEMTVAFRDINPQAPVHFLVVPRKHVASALELDGQDAPLLGAIFSAAKAVAERGGIASSGLRILTNVGGDGGQVVPHLHFHVLGGRRMQWPPG